MGNLSSSPEAHHDFHVCYRIKATNQKVRLDMNLHKLAKYNKKPLSKEDQEKLESQIFIEINLPAEKKNIYKTLNIECKQAVLQEHKFIMGNDILEETKFGNISTERAQTCIYILGDSSSNLRDLEKIRRFLKLKCKPEDLENFINLEGIATIFEQLEILRADENKSGSFLREVMLLNILDIISESDLAKEYISEIL